MTTSSSLTRRAPVLLGCLGLLALPIAVGAAWAAWRFGPRALVRPLDSPQPVVRIDSPASDRVLRTMDQAEIVVEVGSAEPIGWIELWVDGVLYGKRQAVGPTDVPRTMARFLWRVPGPGVHILIARAGDTLGRVGQSPPKLIQAQAPPDGPRLVRLDSEEGETVESIAAAYGLSPDAIRAANPDAADELPAGHALWIPIPPESLPAGYLGDDKPLAPPAPEVRPDAGASQPAAVVSDAGPRLLIPGLAWEFGTPRVPEAPLDLAASSAGDCQVDLTFSDSSLAETGFRVYRFSREGPGFVRVADLEGHREAGGLSFSDTVPFSGRHLYYVTSVNAWGETPGPLQPVDVAPADCESKEAPSAGGSLTLKLEVVSLTTSPGYGSAYCYLSLSFAGGGHVRLPAGEDQFFEAEGDGWDIASHAAGDHGFPFTQPVDDPFTVGMSCWAWSGDDLVDLGEFEASHPSDEWRASLPQDFHAQAGGLSGGGFEVTYRLGPHILSPLTERLDDECLFPCNPDYPAPYDLRHPDTREECQAHANLPDGDLSDGAWAAPWACGDVALENLWIWEWDGSDVLTRSMLSGFDVYTFPSLAAWRDFDPEWVDAVGSAAQVMPLHRPSCGQIYVYAARAFWFEPDAAGSLTELETWYSQAVSIEGPECPRGATVEFRLQSLTVDGARDVDGLEALCFFCDEDRTLEGYGLASVSVFDPELGRSWDAGRWILWGDLCGELRSVDVCPDHTRSIRDGTIQFEDEDRLYRCDSEGTDGPMSCSNHPANRTRITFPIYSGQEIRVSFTLRDEDGATGDDVFCSGEHTTGAVSIQTQRARVGEAQPFFFLSDTSETGTECRISFEYEYLAIYPAEED